MAFYMEIMTPSGSGQQVSSHAISSLHPPSSPRVFDDKPAFGGNPAKAHAGFISDDAAGAEATRPPLPVTRLLLWITCQGPSEPNYPVYEPSDESREPLNKYMPSSPIMTKPFARQNGLNGILHSPRSLVPREKRDWNVRWRDNEVSMEATMFRNTTCGGRSALADVVDDSARMRRTPSIPLRRQPTPSIGAGNSNPLTSTSDRQHRTLFSNPLSPRQSPGNFEKADPILAFRGIKLDSQPLGLYNDQGVKVAGSSKMIRSPSPHPNRLPNACTNGSQKEEREEPQLAPTRTRPEHEQPSLASSPITRTSTPKKSANSRTITESVPKKPATTNYAEIVWKSKGSEHLKKEKSTQKPSRNVATNNGNRSKALSGHVSSSGSTPRKKIDEYSPSAPTIYIPTAASYDESTVAGNLTSEVRYAIDEDWGK